LSRMFSFISETWNPLAGGPCPHRCIYCWSMGPKGLVKRHGMKKYHGPFRLVEKELDRGFKSHDFVFVQDMSDLFADNVPTRYILAVLDHIRRFSKTNFLLLTKNPRRYIRLCDEGEIPSNVVLGATVETNFYRFYGPSTKFEWLEYSEISHAPPPAERLVAMQTLFDEHTKIRRFISIEPVLDFSIDTFARSIKVVRPWAVAVGYDNYRNRLPEPPLKKTLRLIEELEKFTTVYRKTLRKAWWEREKE